MVVTTKFLVLTVCRYKRIEIAVYVERYGT